MKDESIFSRTAINLNRKIGNSTVGKADSLYREKVALLNEAEKNYIHDIVHLNACILKIKDLNLPNGKGTYSGYLLNGIPHGKGKVVFSDFSYYDGFFEDGKMTGDGMRFYSANKKLPSYTEEGMFIDGVWQGKLLRNPLNEDSSVELSGEKALKKDRKHITTKKKEIDYIAGLILKEGNYTGSIYEITETGLMVPHGRGKLITLNHDIFEGDFFDGEFKTGLKICRKDGKEVKFLTINIESKALNKGSFFTPGCFSPAELNGEGAIFRKDGSEKGNFLDGKLNGYGKKTKTRNDIQTIQIGIFKKGMFTKEARIVNNIIYYSLDGKFDENDLLTGTGKIKRLDGTKIKGYFVKGQLQENRENLLSKSTDSKELKSINS